jgi:hypothetical protein
MNQAQATNVYKLSDHLPDLTSRAMLVGIKISIWDGYAYSEEATLDGFGSKSLGRASKSLLKHSEQFKKTKAAFNAVRTEGALLSVPWKDDGKRLFPSSEYFNVSSALQDAKDNAEKELRVLQSVWTQEVANDEHRFYMEALKTGKNSLFNEKDYPQEISTKFKVSIVFEPIATSAHFDVRIGISDDDKAELDLSVQQAQMGITTHLLDELTKPMILLAEHLAKPVEDIKRFHESLVTNVGDAARRVSLLNVNNDEGINSLIREVKSKLSAYTASPCILKDDQGVRDAARAKLNSMLNAFGGSNHAK